MQVQPVKTQSLEQGVYLSIKDMIVSLKLKPGEMLNINSLANVLEVSITPVRAALQILEQENLVRRVHNKGFYVTPLTMADVEYVYEMRRSLEILALERSIVSIDRCELMRLIVNMKDLQQRYTRQRPDIQPFDLDYSLHDMIITYCGNPYLQNTYKLLMSNIQRYRNLIRQVTMPDDDEWIRSELNEHILIGEAIYNNDLKTASDLMYRHITHLIAVVGKRLASARLPADEDQKERT